MDKVRVGLIGCGGIANYHVSHLIEMPDVEIVAVADPVEERRLAMAQKTGAKRIYQNHTELYDAEETGALDAVYICIEPTAHTDTEERAIEKDWHFLVEKPMTLDMAKAERIAAAVAAKGLLTHVGFQDRYLDIIEPLKAELSKHKTGIVYGAWMGGIPMVWWWLKKSTCGGQLAEQNIHLVDMLRYFFGEPKSVYATCSRGIVEPFAKNGVEYDTDDHSTCVITFENSVTATLFSGCYGDYSLTGFEHNGLTIITHDMTIEYKLRNSASFITGKGSRTVRTQVDQGMTLDRTFMDAVKSGDGSAIRSPYGDAQKSLRLALAANESMETGKVVQLG